MNKNNIIETDILIRFLAEETSEAETERVQNWLKESDENMEHFRQVKSLWEGSLQKEMLDTKYHLDSSWESVSNKIQKPVISIKRFWIKVAVAASILIILGSGAVFYYVNYQKESTVASNNNVSKITFPDNSVVWLNRNSKLSYKKNFKSSRHIKLSGEAYFQVTADASHPFTIATSNAIITVIGTKFNVKACPEDTATEVTVTTGKVKISSLVSDNNAKNEILIQPGEKGLGLNNSNSPIKIAANNPNYMSWKTRDFTFNNTNIRDIIQLVNEIYDTHIIIESSNTENCNLTGKYSCHSLDDMLDMLRIVLNITVEKRGETIIINTNEC
jgi:ferric-dicitrate binding protein FerR (iron transport regulator)